jgi:hypothetical protein
MGCVDVRAIGTGDSAGTDDRVGRDCGTGGAGAGAGAAGATARADGALAVARPLDDEARASTTDVLAVARGGAATGPAGSG